MRWLWLIILILIAIVTALDLFVTCINAKADRLEIIKEDIEVLLGIESLEEETDGEEI